MSINDKKRMGMPDMEYKDRITERKTMKWV
jgi:hypothetical protein